jgi:integrase
VAGARGRGGAGPRRALPSARSVNTPAPGGEPAPLARRLGGAAAGRAGVTVRASVTPPGAGGLPSYVTPEQARAVVDAARTTQDRPLLETLWQSGGRVSEVLRLRRCDVDPAEGTLALANPEQRRRTVPAERVDVSTGLVAALLAYARDARVPPTGPVSAPK